MSHLLRLIAALGLIGLFLWSFGTAEVGARLRQADAGWIAVAVACLLAQTALMTLRWRLVARCLGLDLPLPWAIREYLIAQLVNQTLPGGVLGDGARAVRARVGESGLRRAAQSVVIERAMGQIGLLAVAVIGLGWAIAAPGALAWPPALARAVALAGLIGLGLAGLALMLLRGGRIARLIRCCLPTPRLARSHALLSVGAAALNVAGFAAAARATGTALDAQAALVIAPLILTAMLVPLTVAGWGWREGAAAVLFPVAGAAPAAGVAAGIAFGAAMLLAAMPALPLLLLPRPGGPGEAAAPPGRFGAVAPRIGPDQGVG